MTFTVFTLSCEHNVFKWGCNISFYKCVLEEKNSNEIIRKMKNKNNKMHYFFHYSTAVLNLLNAVNDLMFSHLHIIRFFSIEKIGNVLNKIGRHFLAFSKLLYAFHFLYNKCALSMFLCVWRCIFLFFCGNWQSVSGNVFISIKEHRFKRNAFHTIYAIVMVNSTFSQYFDNSGTPKLIF